METFNIKVEGYWRDVRKKGLPSYPGIFFVYEALYNSVADTVTLIRIIYIGEADNINERVSKHERYNDWKAYVRAGHELSFSAGQIAGHNRTRVKAAFIFKLKPIANRDYKQEFPFVKTMVQSTGKTALLEESFEV